MTLTNYSGVYWLVRAYCRSWIVAFYIEADNEELAKKRAKAKIEFLQTCSWKDFQEYVVPGTQQQERRFADPKPLKK